MLFVPSTDNYSMYLLYEINSFYTTICRGVVQINPYKVHLIFFFVGPFSPSSKTLTLTKLLLQFVLEQFRKEECFDLTEH